MTVPKSTDSGGRLCLVGCNVNLVSPVGEATFILPRDPPLRGAQYSWLARSRQTIISDWVKRKGLIKIMIDFEVLLDMNLHGKY